MLTIEDWSTFYTGISSDLSTHLLLRFLKSVEMVMEVVGNAIIQALLLFCFKRSGLHSKAILSNIVLLIFTVNREATFPWYPTRGMKKITFYMINWSHKPMLDSSAELSVFSLLLIFFLSPPIGMTNNLYENEIIK